MIVADLDGVVVVPFEEIDAVAERAARILELEKAGEAAVSNGLILPESVEAILQSDRIRWVE